MGQLPSTADFLNVVLPQGNHYIGYMDGTTGPSGRQIIKCSAFTDGAQGVSIANRHQNRDVFFALASFKEQKIYDEKNGYMKSYRHQDNVDEVKSIWLDVDFKQYDSPEETVHAIKSFLDNGIPDPTFVVHSGGGLHLYWVFEEALPLTRWQALAHGLAGLAKRLDLRADLGVTIDSARVLRLPGTHNQKYDDKPLCRIMKMGNYANLDRMSELLHGHAYTPDRQLSKTYAIPSNVVQMYDPTLVDDLTGGYKAGMESYAKRIAEKCGTLRHALETHGEGTNYPLWKDTLHLLAFTEDGEKYAHEVSNGHEGYSEQETQARYDESVVIKQEGRRGPTSCARFSGHTDSKCATCKFHGTIKSPWSLGVTVEEKRAPTHIVGEKTYKLKMARNPETGELEAEEVHVCNYALDNWELIPVVGDKESKYNLNFTARANKYSAALNVPESKAVDSRGLKSHLAAQGFTLPENQIKIFMEAVMAWLEKLKQESDVKPIERYGWTSDRKGFVVGKEVITALGSTPIEVSGGIAVDFEQKGNPKYWQQLADKMVKSPRPEYEFMICAGFASMIMSFGFSSSLAVSAYSQQSGVGKSTALEVVQSAFGRPKGMFSLDDTPNYIAQKTGTLNDLPSLWDEIRTRKGAEEMSKVLFRITQGKTKGRLDSHADMRETHEFTSMLMMATNVPLAEYIENEVQQTDAGNMRFMEFDFDLNSNKVQSDRSIDLLRSKIQDNHGHSGRLYARWLIQHMDKVEPAIEATTKLLEDAVGFKQSERFWREGMAKTLATAYLLKASGTLDVDPDRVQAFIVDLVGRQREAAVEVTVTRQADELDDIINMYSTHMLVTTALRAIEPGQPHTTVHVRRAPYGGDRKPMLQVGLRQKVLVLPMSTLREYCHDTGKSVKATRKNLLNRQKTRTAKITIGAGTDYVGAQINCLLLDISHCDDLISSFDSALDKPQSSGST